MNNCGKPNRPAGVLRRRLDWRRRWRDNRASLLVEFAIVGPVFILLLLVVFETAYDLYLQAVLDSTLQATARQIQVGGTEATGAPDASTQANLVSNYLCPNGLNLLKCSSLYVRVERVDTTACPGGAGQADVYNAAVGQLPIINGVIGLGLYGGGGGSAGATTCESASSTSGYCVAGPSTSGAPELIILSALYITPSFLGGLVVNRTTFNGKIVRGVFSSAAFITEGYKPSAGAPVTTC